VAGPPPRRGYPLSTHRGVEAALGFALIFLALVLALDPGGNFEFSTAGAAAAGVFGLALATLGVATPREGTGVGPASHRAFDIAIVAGLAIVAILFATRGDTTEVIIFAAAALAHGLLTARTRYTIAGGE
jgi:hypothetical protein